MFDVDLADGESYRESNNYRAGESAVLADLPWGRLGLTICYDLRFPALYRALAEAGAIVAGGAVGLHQADRRSALACAQLRARAIENGCFVLAAAQGGKHENGRETFGHSLIVDPWGRVLAEGGTEPGVVMAEIDPARSRRKRAARIPSLQHGRRFEIVEPLAEPAHLHRRAGRRNDPIRARLRHRATSSKAGSRIPPPTTSRRKRKLVACPHCGCSKVEKAIMAPRLAARKSKRPATEAPARIVERRAGRDRPRRSR